MKNNISHEYAEALFLLSCEEKSEEKYLSDLRLVKKIFEKEPEYLELLHSPSIGKEEKLNLIESAFGGSVNEHVVSFLKIFKSVSHCVYCLIHRRYFCSVPICPTYSNIGVFKL